MNDSYESRILPKTFYALEPEKVAECLIGKYLVRKIDSSYLVGKIVEVEAYLSSNDPAAHNYKGKTARNKSLFSDAGKAYVHSLRQYNLIDVVTEGEELPGSVLIRAVEPIEGIELMANFGGTDLVEKLANGPGKLCRSFDIKRIHDGLDLTLSSSPIFICSSNLASDLEIMRSARIGISKATDLQLRFFLKESPFISGTISPRKRKSL